MKDTIIKKLRYTPGMTASILNAPEDFHNFFSKQKDGSAVHKEPVKGMEWIMVFVYNKKDIETLTPKAFKVVNSETIFWFAYPKKSSNLKTDITRDKGWDTVHNLGWKGVSMISIDDTWSAFRIKPQKSEPTRPTSDASVKGATGRNWKEWFKEMKGFEANQKSHREIAQALSEDYNLDGWWSQMITNAFEQNIGRRKKHEMADGYQVSVSKTFGKPISEAYRAFVVKNIRKTWLQDPDFKISTARENKSIRALWVDRKTRISVDFYAKGDEKTQVVVQHLKLPDSKACEKIKSYWKKNLANLTKILIV